MKRNRKKSAGPLKAFQALPEDLRLLSELKAKIEAEQGKTTETALIRMGLRALAEAKGINLVQP